MSWWKDRIVTRCFNHVETNLVCFVLQLYIGGTWYYAEYSTFSIDPESNKYTLQVSGYSGNAGDSLLDPAISGTVNLNGMGFTTSDVDNDRWPGGSCAQNHGGGWWFNYCQYACFTCRYNDTFRWQSLSYLSTDGLQAARMMIKANWATTKESDTIVLFRAFTSCYSQALSCNPNRPNTCMLCLTTSPYMLYFCTIM